MCDMKIKNTTSGKNDHLHSVVKIECGENEGTAICIYSSDTSHLFLTCAHVVQYRIQSVILHYDGHVIKGRVIYATCKDIPYDIAVIESEIIANVLPCEISDTAPAIGQEVFAVGYACKEKKMSTVFGSIQKISFALLTTTCNVRAGFSGGPVFTIYGKLLGLTIGKLNVGSVNFVLPSAEFDQTIKMYAHSKDMKILNNLESKCPLKNMLWNNGIPNLNVFHI